MKSVVTINKYELVKHSFDRVMGRITARMGSNTGTYDLAVNMAINNQLGLDFDTVSNLPKSGTEANSLISGLIDSIEKRVEHFCDKSLYQSMIYTNGTEGDTYINHQLYKRMIAMESAEEKEDDETDPFGDNVSESEVDSKMSTSETTIAQIIADLLKEVVKGDTKSVADVAEQIVTISKDNAEENKTTAEGEEDIFAVDNDGEGEENNDGENDDKDGAKKSKKKSSTSDDPFGDNGGNDKPEDGGDNPFAGGGDSSNDSANDDSGNPFEDKNDGKTGKESEIFRNIRDITINTFGLESLQGHYSFKPFAGLTNNAFNRFAKYIGDQTFGNDMHETYNKFGIESAEFKDVKKKYIDISKCALHATIAAGIACTVLNTPFLEYKLSNPELFV